MRPDSVRILSILMSVGSPGSSGISWQANAIPIVFTRGCAARNRSSYPAPYPSRFPCPVKGKQRDDCNPDFIGLAGDFAANRSGTQNVLSTSTEGSSRYERRRVVVLRSMTGTMTRYPGKKRGDQQFCIHFRRLCDIDHNRPGAVKEGKQGSTDTPALFLSLLWCQCQPPLFYSVRISCLVFAISPSLWLVPVVLATGSHNPACIPT